MGDRIPFKRFRRTLSVLLILSILTVFFISIDTANDILSSQPNAESIAQWELLDISNYNDTEFQDIHFVNSTHGWVLGENRLLHTSDGGETWQSQIESIFPSYLHGLSVVNSTNIWVGENGGLFHSVDGGLNWTIVHTPHPFGENHPTNVEFYNSTHGIIGDKNGMYRSTDGGNTWQNISMSTSHSFPRDFHLTSTTIWIASANGIIRSDNWGDTWQIESAREVRSLDFITEEEAWMINGDNSISYFFGGYWYDLPIIGRPTMRPVLNDIDFVDSNHGWAVGWFSSVTYTNDGGITWYEQEWYDEILGPFFECVDFINETHGWAAGWSLYGGGGVIARTQTGNLLGSQMHTGQIILGRFIPYFSLFVGLSVSGIYSSVIGLWLYRRRSQRETPENNAEVSGVIDTSQN